MQDICFKLQLVFLNYFFIRFGVKKLQEEIVLASDRVIIDVFLIDDRIC
jgi:hypothetical protein